MHIKIKSIHPLQFSPVLRLGIYLKETLFVDKNACIVCGRKKLGKNEVSVIRE